MSDYEEFKIDALEQYAALPYETNELYKKYYMDVPLPNAEELESARKVSLRNEVEAYVRLIEQNTKLKFDLVFSNSFVRNNSKVVSISKMSELDGRLEGKMLKSADNKLAAFVNAHSRDVIVVEIEPGKAEKLNILFVNDSHLMFQSIFDVKEGASLDLFELYASLPGSGSLVAPLQEFSVRKDAHLEFTLLNDGNEQSQLLNISKGVLEENAKINVNFIYNGSGLTKSLGFFDAHGRASHISATEMIYGTKEQRFDINTYVFNSKERSYTRLETGAVLDGSSYCLLKGYAKVERLTKGAFSRVNQRGIVLGDKAHVDALPDMSIDYSDEVSATHSAATSPIDKEVLFYMESRGIEESNARKMFVSSFVTKYLSSIQNPSVKEIALSIMLSRVENDDFGVINAITPRGVWLTSTASK